jgi:hypothetical protein
MGALRARSAPGRSQERRSRRGCFRRVLLLSIGPSDCVASPLCCRSAVRPRAPNGTHPVRCPSKPVTSWRSELSEPAWSSEAPEVRCSRFGLFRKLRSKPRALTLRGCAASIRHKPLAQA